MGLKALVFSDIHAEEQALDRLRTIAMRSKYDTVIMAGDVTNRGPVSFATELVELFPDSLYIVHGNMDTPEVISALKQSGRYIHGKKKKIGEWNIVGLGGSNPTPFHTPCEYTEAEIAKILENADVDEYTILVSHPPPFGIFDEVKLGDGNVVNAGSTAVRECIEKRRPLVVISGHIHENEGHRVVGDTFVIKVGSAQALRAAELEIGEDIKVNFINL